MTVPAVQWGSAALGYPVYCHDGALDEVGEIIARLAPAHQYVVVSDETVAPLYAARVLERLPAQRAQLVTVPPGEEQKTRAQWMALTDAMSQRACGRDTTVIALGGGVIGDLAGFVAATYMRGIPYVQVPTTLLAMVDASVGGKTAVDTSYGKNLVGAFHNPRAVIIDPAVLGSLSPALLRSGLAEMIKHGVIADAAYFDDLLKALPSIASIGSAAPALPRLIAGSVGIKAAVVSEDAGEHGRRHILNFGHTIAHAIERELDFAMLHGEAVAVGMVVEARIAEALGLCSNGVTDAVMHALDLAGLSAIVPAGLTAESILASTHGDKKARSGLVRYALPRSLGVMEPANGRWSVAVEDSTVLAALRASQ